MKVYTVLATNSNGFEQDVVEPYATLDLAFKRAKELVSNLCGEGSHIVRTLSSIKLEWAILDGDDPEHVLYNDNGIYVAIWVQELATSLPVQNEDHYDATAKRLAKSMCKEEDERILSELHKLDAPTTPAPTCVPVDDPAHWSLPAGWNKDHKPIFMQWVYDTINEYGDLEDMLPISELTENEKFALTLSRISQRPHYSFTFGSRTWDQSEARYALKTRTWDSYDMVEREMEQLQNIFDDYIKEHEEAEEV